MPFADLRAWIRHLENSRELARVKVAVEKDHEVAAICRTVNDALGPGLLFENVVGYGVSLACNLIGTRRRFAMALEMREETLTEEWLTRTRGTYLEPKVISDGPCHEQVRLGNEVDLLAEFPVPIWNELDGGPYITLPIVITRDPDTGERNAAMYRMQVHGKNRLGILMAPYRHGEMHRMKALARGQRFPVAIAIGTDPAVALASLAPVPYGTDELALAGALRGEPIEVVRCVTSDLEAPATAEIVLEGEVLMDEQEEEGPYGEFTGYYGPKVKRPVVEIKAITHRDQTIYHGLYNGRPPTEEHVIRGIPMEIQIVQQCPLPGIKKVNLTLGGCANFNAVVSIEKRFEGAGKMMGLAILGTTVGRLLKNLVIVDGDIDPSDWVQVEWALATRMQPHRDVDVIKDLAGVLLDPSLPVSEKITGRARTSKMIIDATRYDAAEYEVPCMPKADTTERVARDWAKYGINLMPAGPLQGRSF